jgi:hypothetical protein
MENKKLIFWIALDILLLIIALFVCSYWFKLSADLKSPCYSCAKERPEIKPCLMEPLIQNEFNLNFSEIIIINNNKKT